MVVMEVRAGALYQGCEIAKFGHEVRLMALI